MSPLFTLQTVYTVYTVTMAEIRKMIPVSEKTHAQLTRLIAKAVVKNKGRRITFDEMINSLMSWESK